MGGVCVPDQLGFFDMSVLHLKNFDLSLLL